MLRIDQSPPMTQVHIVPSWIDVPASGVGEPGLSPFAPALCNAIFAATRQTHAPPANRPAAGDVTRGKKTDSNPPHDGERTSHQWSSKKCGVVTPSSVATGERWPSSLATQDSAVLALSRTLRAGFAGAAAVAAASLTAAARGALPEGRSGQRDGRFDRTKG